MAYKIVTAPAVEPVTLTEAKSHLRISGYDNHAELAIFIASAREHTERLLNRALITQTIDLYLDAFPEKIELPLSPVQSVTSINYTDVDGATQLLASSGYTVTVAAEPAYIIPSYGNSWPDSRAVPEAVVVRYVAGYGAAETDVPDSIRSAILLLVGHLYENRENSLSGTIITDIPFGYSSLVAPHRLGGRFT